MFSLGSILSSFFLRFFLFSTSRGYDDHLHFYFHEIFTGPNQNSVIVARSNLTSSVFGDLSVFDCALTVTQDPNSRLIGRAEGMAASTSLSDESILTTINYVFTAGEYKGSTLSLLGRVPATGTAERTVVGGTGWFRLARGFAISNVIYTSSASLIVELDFYLFLY